MVSSCFFFLALPFNGFSSGEASGALFCSQTLATSWSTISIPRFSNASIKASRPGISSSKFGRACKSSASVTKLLSAAFSNNLDINFSVSTVDFGNSKTACFAFTGAGLCLILALTFLTIFLTGFLAFFITFFFNFIFFAIIKYLLDFFF